MAYVSTQYSNYSGVPFSIYEEMEKDKEAASKIFTRWLNMSKLRLPLPYGLNDFIESAKRLLTWESSTKFSNETFAPLHMFDKEGKLVMVNSFGAYCIKMSFSDLVDEYVEKLQEYEAENISKVVKYDIFRSKQFIEHVTGIKIPVLSNISFESSDSTYTQAIEAQFKLQKEWNTNS